MPASDTVQWPYLPDVFKLSDLHSISANLSAPTTLCPGNGNQKRMQERSEMQAAGFHNPSLWRLVNSANGSQSALRYRKMHLRLPQAPPVYRGAPRLPIIGKSHSHRPTRRAATCRRAPGLPIIGKARSHRSLARQAVTPRRADRLPNIMKARSHRPPMPPPPSANPQEGAGSVEHWGSAARPLLGTMPHRGPITVCCCTTGGR